MSTPRENAWRAFWEVVYSSGTTVATASLSPNEYPEEMSLLRRHPDSRLQRTMLLDIEPTLAEKLRRLEIAVVEWAKGSYAAGYGHGSNMLKQMASGKISVNEFDDELIRHDRSIR